MKIAAIQSNYIPWKGYFDIIRRVDAFYLYDCVQFTARDWRNRNRIKTPGGLRWLTIPLTYRRRNERICEKTVADPGWAERHWQTLRHAYAAAPFFSRYQEIFEPLYRGCREPMLSRINQRFLEAINALLGITTPLIPLSEFERTGEKSEDLIKLCREAGASVYLTGPTTRAYLEEARFNAAGIRVEWMEYDYPEYRQLYPPFEHKVSVLDLLFNEGPDARRHLESA